MDAVTFEAALQHRAADILTRCVACGACAEVCPMPGPAGIDTADPRALTAGVLSLPARRGACGRRALGQGLLRQRPLHSGLPARRQPPLHAGAGAAASRPWPNR